MAATLNDLCPGWSEFHPGGVNGVCCCGLYWEKKMPCHLRNGQITKLERLEKRSVEANKARERLGKERRELEEKRRLVFSNIFK